MNPLTNVRNIQKLNQTELQLGVIGKKSWHDQYKDSAWIFIGGLPYDLTEGDILCVFSQYGEIVNMNLVRDKDTGKSKGYGFICYEDQRSTVLAVDNLNSIKLLGRVIRVDHVENYKAPKEHGDEDEITKRLRDEGCAPSIQESSSDEEEIIPTKKPKKEKDPEKRSKKKKKKEKKRKKADTSSSEDERSHAVRVKIEKEDSGYERQSGPKHSEKYDDRHKAERYHRDSGYRNGVDRVFNRQGDRRDRVEFGQNRGDKYEEHSRNDRGKMINYRSKSDREGSRDRREGKGERYDRYR